MFGWLAHCCTPGLRKAPAGVEGKRIVDRKAKPKGVRSLSTHDLPDNSSGSSSRQEPLFREHLKILSYNIFVRPEIPIATGTEYQDLRMDLFCENVLGNYDIVCLQEMFNLPLSSRRHGFVEQAKGMGFLWEHHGSRNHSLSPTIDGGLMILSRLPIVRTDTLNFKSAAFADWYAAKGVLYCLIQVGPKEHHYVHVFCTHLQATYDQKGLEVSARVRREQLKQTVDFIMKCVKNREEWPIAICGDLNVQCRRSGQDGTDSEEYVAMLRILRDGFGMQGELLRDLAKEIDGATHPVTFADSHVDQFGNVYNREVELTDAGPEWANQSLDKIFWIPATDGAAAIEPVITNINPMFVDKESWEIKKDHPLTHLSDHYAIETHLHVKLNNPNSNSY